MGRAVFPPCCLTWNQTMVEVMKIMVTSIKVPCTHCYTQCPQPWSRPPLTHASAGDSWTLMGMSRSVSCGITAPFSGVLVHTRFCVCPPRACFQSPVSSGGSLVELMVISSQKAYTKPMCAAPRAPSPVAGHCWSVPVQETLKHSKAGLAQSLWGFLLYRRFCLCPLSVFGQYGVWF